ncbi:MAG TPA: Xaa-Pro peptidase family protein [Candidatus Binatia bacterium]|nr:Xaa-Pro peptidase family protein [Candidatus Binatia bacterium]
MDRTDGLEKVVLPKFSLAERDRRWKAVRQAMSDKGIDCLVVTGSTEKWDHFFADVRYLSHIGGNCTQAFVIFPLQEEPTCIIREKVRADFWIMAQDWVKDIRDSSYCHWGDAIVNRLKELKLEKGTIGITGLRALRAPEGFLPSETHRKIVEAFPQSKLVSASNLVADVRRIKSSEEIAFMKKAGEVLDAGLEAMVKAARSGVREYEIYADLVHGMMRAGGDYLTMLYWKSGKAPYRTEHIPTHKILERGDVIINELDGRYCGYFVQAIHPISVGPPPKDYAEMFKLSVEAFNRMVEAMKPGVIFGRLWEVFEKTVEGSPYQARHPSFHGVGLGEDEPMDLGDEKWRGVVVEEGMTMMLQPTPVHYPDGKMRRVGTGESVFVTKNGAERFTKRKLEFPVVT